MANPEHPAILEQGAETWNDWRRTSAAQPDLRNVSLFDSKSIKLADESPLFHPVSPDRMSVRATRSLAGIDFSCALLNGSQFDLVNMSGANLEGADLGGALVKVVDLREANLSGAKLHARITLPGGRLTHGTSFIGCLMEGASLDRSSLTGATFENCRFGGADFSEANLNNNRFINCEMGQAKHLHTVRSYGHSAVDHRTLERSPNLPKAFLRLVGLPDAFIDNIPAIFGSPFEFYSAFISYALPDEEFARRLSADLRDNGVRCWFAPEDLKAGDRIMNTINDAIRVQDKLIVILSKHSIERDWVEHEVKQALKAEVERGRDLLVPIRLDNAVFECGFGWAKEIRAAHRPSGRHIADFTDWKNHETYGSAFEKLLRDLEHRESGDS
ncbi:hypothetical protein ABI59_05940 [Acidobacteria bacterium Mor1]|nr:hypothetical protein ABI59_05940 [Acidobacteria bacterium Mor1]